ncbi:hypothetical protein DMH02_009060 [Streptomyces sp. WAC 00631]|uniref:hypothetical protein n=1 Tax=Streptomyces sp. WAC 00631 TaxID=2203201 RepID=UPI001E5E1DA6|nr:hypothetical protein [Streptomyces sp. WAC 00631]MCC5033361.1 hypothetical protein [Streptomyces sp. WAC 00631]
MRTNDGAAAGAAAGGTAGAAAGAGGEGGSVELEFLTPGGEAHRTIARLHTGLRIPGRKPLAARTVTLGDGRRVLQYRLPFSGQSDNAAYGALERQVGAAVALERRYGSERFAEVFTRLVGFDLEAAEPYVLYRAPEGKPLAGRQGTLTVAEQQKLIAQLVLAVRLLEDAGLVHREITPDTVRWDGTHVRLAEPYGAQRIGEPREPFGAAPWAPPEQREGTGTADTRDDLWAVGRLVYFLLSGRPGPAAEPPHDLGEFRRLAAPADSGLFDPRAVNRPRPSDLMRLLQVPDPLSAPAPADPLSAGPASYTHLTLPAGQEAEGTRHRGAAAGGVLRVPRPAPLLALLAAARFPGRPARARGFTANAPASARPAHPLPVLPAAGGVRRDTAGHPGRQAGLPAAGPQQGAAPDAPAGRAAAGVPVLPARPGGRAAPPARPVPHQR